MNDYTCVARDDGALVELWSARCLICGFVTGMARVSVGGRSLLLSGAGCWARRGPKEAAAWAAGAMR